jgi:curli biogenesis system outer membrane secretion channel CsgG
MKHFSEIIAVLALTMLTLSACATRIMVPVTRPAEINLKGMNKIAIGKINGTAGSDMSDALTLKIVDSRRYELVDKTNMDRILFESKLSEDGITDAKTAAKLKKFMGTAAIINGSFSFKYDLTQSIGDPMPLKDGSVTRMRQVY